MPDITDTIAMTICDLINVCGCSLTKHIIQCSVQNHPECDVPTHCHQSLHICLWGIALDDLHLSRSPMKCSFLVYHQARNQDSLVKESMQISSFDHAAKSSFGNVCSTGPILFCHNNRIVSLWFPSPSSVDVKWLLNMVKSMSRLKSQCVDQRQRNVVEYDPCHRAFVLALPFGWDPFCLLFALYRLVPTVSSTTPFQITEVAQVLSVFLNTC